MAASLRARAGGARAGRRGRHRGAEAPPGLDLRARRAGRLLRRGHRLGLELAGAAGAGDRRRRRGGRAFARYAREAAELRGRAGPRARATERPAASRQSRRRRRRFFARAGDHDPVGLDRHRDRAGGRPSARRRPDRPARRGRARGRSPPRRGRRCPRAASFLRRVRGRRGARAAGAARLVLVVGLARRPSSSLPPRPLFLGAAPPRPAARPRGRPPPGRRPRRAGPAPPARRRGRGVAVAIAAGVGGRELVLALELADVPHGDLELVGDPGVGPALADPGPDLVQLGLQRSPCQGRAETTNRAMPPNTRLRGRETTA